MINDNKNGCDNNLVCIAKIVGVHGLQGELKLHSNMQVPEDVKRHKHFVINANKFVVQSIRHYRKNIFLLKLIDVADRNSSEALVNLDVFIDKKYLPPLLEDEFYFDALHGLQVFDHYSKVYLGIVAGVFNFGAGDVIEIQLDLTKESVMIPFMDNWVCNIDLAGRKLFVDRTVLCNMMDEKSGKLIMAQDAEK